MPDAPTRQPSMVGKDIVHKMTVLLVGGNKEGARALADLAEAILPLERQAWEEASKTTRDELHEMFHRGKAHAFCEVLGDQSSLDRLIEQARA